MDPVRVKRLGLAALALSLLTLVVAGILSYDNWRHFRAAAMTVARARAVAVLNDSLMADLADAETGQRGFLLTGRQEYLEPYNRGAERASRDLTGLGAALRNDSLATPQLEELGGLISQKLDELKTTIEIRRTKGLAEAMRVVETDFGKRAMDRIRAVSAAIEERAQGDREVSWSELERQALISRWLSLVGALVLAVFVASGTVALNGALRAQESLAASAARSRDLLGATLYSIGDAVITTDASGAVRRMNPVAERLTGYAEEEARGLPCERVFRIVNEQTRAEVESPVGRVLRDGKVTGLANHTVLIARSGQVVPIDDSGAPIAGPDGAIEGVVLVFRDISERRRAHEALIESERRFRMLADFAPVMIWSETPDGDREYFNRPWLEFRGRTPERERGAAWKEGIHADDRARHDQLLADASAARRPFALEYRLQRADGHYAWVLSRGVPRFGADGEFLGYIGTCTDIDESKLAEEKVRQAAKLESLGVLAGGVAHDFNNLLVGIMGSASLLGEYVPEGSIASELVTTLQQASERAAKLTRQMLAYSGRGRFQVEILDLSRQVREIMALIQASIPKSVNVRLDLAEQLPAIEADASQIQQIVMNLAINAAEACSPGGSVQIASGVQTVGEAGVAAAVGEGLRAGAYAVLTVTDTGAGMDAETKTRIFDPFFTTKFTGRGLGLAAVAGIVRGHQGAITVESSPGSGSTFRVYLPAAAPGGGSPRADSRKE
jgi:PAS domain S-box-containing protein